MSSDRAFGWSCREVVSDADVKQRPGYGVQSTHLHQTMNTDAPLLTPHEEFDYDDSIVAGCVKNGNFSG
jgi:hypothetical protein